MLVRHTNPAALFMLLWLLTSCGGEPAVDPTVEQPRGLSGEYAWIADRDGEVQYHITIREEKITRFEAVSASSRTMDVQQSRYVADAGDFPILQCGESGTALGRRVHQIRFDLDGRLPTARAMAAECIAGHWVTRELTASSDDYPMPDRITRGKLCRLSP